jgi:cell division protein FtsL
MNFIIILFVVIISSLIAYAFLRYASKILIEVDNKIEEEDKLNNSK